MPGLEPFLYAEITREGREPEFMLVAEGVAVGRSHRSPSSRSLGRPGWWRVWVDGRPVTEPVRMRGSSGRWAPIATAESWNGGNALVQRVRLPVRARLGVVRRRRLVAAVRLGASLPRRHEPLRDLAAAPAESGVYRRTLASESVLPYAFVAASAN